MLLAAAHVIQQIGPVQPLTLFYRSPKARATLFGSRRRLNHESRELPFHRFAIVFLNRRPGGEFHGMEKQGNLKHQFDVRAFHASPEPTMSKAWKTKGNPKRARDSSKFKQAANSLRHEPFHFGAIPKPRHLRT
ncbi:MAG: hypothetical protein R3B96_19740 [Pirellulaceae bacterium]